MQRILILGGGVGGTLTANLLVKKLRGRIDRGEIEIMVVDATGQHVYQPGFMYIAMGGERAANLQRPERGLLDKRVTLVVGEVAARRRVPAGRDPGRRPAARLRPSRAGDRLAHRARGDRALRYRGSPFLHRRWGSPVARRAGPVRRRPDRHRHRRDALQVPAGAARGRVPDRVRAARPRHARPHLDRLLLADRPRVHDRERVRHGDADPRGEGHRAAYLLQRRGHRSRAQGRPQPRGRGARLRPAHPRPAAQGPAVPDGLRARPGAGRLAADRPPHAARRRPAQRLRPG